MEDPERPVHRDPADELERNDLLDTDDALTAEFRYRIGLLPEEEEGLTEAFKASIGLTGPEALPETSEVDIALERQFEVTLKTYKFEKFAKKNFQGAQSADFSREQIREPLLVKRHDVDKMCAPLIWTAIQRFMGDAPIPTGVPPSKDKTPIMTKIYRKLELQSKRRKSDDPKEPKEELVAIRTRPNRDSEKRKSWRKVFSSSKSSVPATNVAPPGDNRRLSRTESTASSGSSDINSNDVLVAGTDSIPTGELDLIHYVIGHGILRRDLRDEIYCQLCKQLRKNPSRTSCLNGWILLALCAGCFGPSDSIANYLQSAMRDCPKDYHEYSIYTRRILKRTSMNGPRYHPPNWLEYQATKLRKYVLLPVALPDGRMESIEADSAMTAGEICAKVASNIDLKDQFGFSLFITIYDKVSSLGSGLDHVMDAISECEQLMRTKARREEDAPWRLYFRKEAFVPWHDPEMCPVATELIYRQIAKGIRTEEYKTRADDELIRFAARKWYIENGSEFLPGKLQAELHTYLPRSALLGTKSREGWTQAIWSSFTEQGFDKMCVPSNQVKWHIVVSSPAKWPLQFAGLFEAFRVNGPRLPRNDIVLAVSGRGVFILDEPYRVVTAYKFFEIVEVFNRRSTRSQGPTLTLITIKGEEYTFLSPNAETIARMIGTFLNGLRQRSKVAVGLQEFFLDDQGSKKTFHFRQGDVIELLDDPPSRDDWVVGVVERTRAKGEFPIDAVYILPAIEKPPADFLSMFALMSAGEVNTLPKKRGALKLDPTTGKTGTVRRHGVESAA